MALRIAPGVAWQTIDGEAVVLDVDRGCTLGLNATGTLVLSLLESRDQAAIAAELSRRFEVTPERAAADLTAFVAALRARDLVVEA